MMSPDLQEGPAVYEDISLYLVNQNSFLAECNILVETIIRLMIPKSKKNRP